jgi:hypothetical protein
MGGSVRVARGEHSQHRDMDFTSSTKNAVRRLLRVQQRGGAARRTIPPPVFRVRSNLLLRRFWAPGRGIRTVRPSKLPARN